MDERGLVESLERAALICAAMQLGALSEAVYLAADLLRGERVHRPDGTTWRAELVRERVRGDERG